MAHGSPDTTGGIFQAFSNEVDMAVERIGDVVDLGYVMLVGDA